MSKQARDLEDYLFSNILELVGLIPGPVHPVLLQGLYVKVSELNARIKIEQLVDQFNVETANKNVGKGKNK